MKLLVLGGTKFLGRAVVEAALARGDEVTLFNRGETNPELFADAEKLRGNRDGDLSALEGRSWNAVVDTSGYVPRVVRASAELLADAVEYYVFVSTISVYRDPFVPMFDESAPLTELDDPDTEDVQKHYGGLKAACERVVEEVFPGRSTLVRAGLIVGPHDPTGRFTYWPHRIARGGEVLAPGDRAAQVQFVDVRDLGEWIARICEERFTGPVTATGPVRPLTMGELLATCQEVSDSDASLTWIDEDFLLEREVGQWMELPLWVAAADAAFLQADVTRAVTSGLTFRPLEETIQATLDEAELTEDAGMAPDREAALLADWRSRA